MKYFQRGSIWWGRWSVNGQQVRVSSRTSNEKLAKIYLADEYAKSFKKELLNEKPRRTWKEAVGRYLEDRQHLRTIGAYEDHKVWWDGEFAKRNVVYIDQITPDVVREIRTAEFSRPKLRGGGKRSAADVNRKIALLRAVIRAAYKEYRWIDGEAPMFRFIPGQTERMRRLQPEEVVRLAKSLPEGYADLLYMAVATGLRRRNVLRMRWDQIDFGHRLLRVDGVQMKNGETLVIPLNQMAVDIILRHKDNGSEWVFPLNAGKPLNEISSKIWRQALQKAGLENLRWHDMRHTWASLLRESGVPMADLKELGGWKDARMVERYAHLSVDHLSKHAVAIDSVFAVDKRLKAVG